MCIGPPCSAYGKVPSSLRLISVTRGSVLAFESVVMGSNLTKDIGFFKAMKKRSLRRPLSDEK